MIAIVDYGVGNLFSLKSSFDFIGEQVVVTSKEEEIINADKIILPGVGAFGDAIKKLKDTKLDKVIIEQARKGKHILGICLGMQLLFDKSYEYGEYSGLGLISGNVKSMSGVINEELKVPHMGWNGLIIKKESPLFKYVKNGEHVYFVHSYYGADCTESVIATAEYDKELTAAVQNGNVFGCQFHPEKSGEVGLKILKAFCEL